MACFPDLPTVLQDLITFFAFNITSVSLLDNVDVLLSIKDHNLPTFFYKTYVDACDTPACLWKSRKNAKCSFVVNPIAQYFPIFEYKGIFNMYLIHELLYCLDFRKRAVRAMGSRWFWIQRMADDYEFVVFFGVYYKMLLATEANIWTPSYASSVVRGDVTFRWH